MASKHFPKWAVGSGRRIIIIWPATCRRLSTTGCGYVYHQRRTVLGQGFMLVTIQNVLSNNTLASYFLNIFLYLSLEVDGFKHEAFTAGLVAFTNSRQHLSYYGCLDGQNKTFYDQAPNFEEFPELLPAKILPGTTSV
jgi:hypothetical protein